MSEKDDRIAELESERDELRVKLGAADRAVEAVARVRDEYRHELEYLRRELHRVEAERDQEEETWYQCGVVAGTEAMQKQVERLESEHDELRKRVKQLETQDEHNQRQLGKLTRERADWEKHYHAERSMHMDTAREVEALEEQLDQWISAAETRCDSPVAMPRGGGKTTYAMKSEREVERDAEAWRRIAAERAELLQPTTQRKQQFTHHMRMMRRIHGKAR